MPKCHYIIFIANSIENIHRNTRQYYTFKEKYFNGKVRLQQTYDITCNTSIDNQYDTCQKSEIVDGRRGYTYFISVFFGSKICVKYLNSKLTKYDMVK